MIDIHCEVQKSLIDNKFTYFKNAITPEVSFPFINEFKSFSNFLISYPGSLHYHSKNGVTYVASGELQNHLECILSSPQTVTFEGVGLHFKEVSNMRKWISEHVFNRDVTKTMCGGFYSPKNEGVQRHFDDRDVIVMQLIGNKYWTLEDNTDFNLIKKPFSAWFEPGYSDAVKTYGITIDEIVKHKFFSNNSKTIKLEPGDVLFLPKGMWHSTFAEEDSFSLSFGCP